MENRKKVENPVPHESPLKTKPDDFEPELTSNGPLRDDGPTPPPPPRSYDIEVPRPDTAGK